MSPRIRRLAAALGVAGLLAVGVAACGGETTSTSASADGQPPAASDQSQQGYGQQGAPGQQGTAPGGAQQGGAPGQGQPGGPDLGELASALGVSEDDLQAAMEKTRPQPGDGGGAQSDPIEALADELGLSADEVRSAMQELMPQGGQPPQGPMGQQGGAPPSADGGDDGSSSSSSGAQTS